MCNFKIKFLLRITCFLMTSVMLDIFSFAAGPSDESIPADLTLGSSSPINIKIPGTLFIDTAAARRQAQKAAEIEAARIEEENRIQEEQQARIDAKKKRNRRRQQRKQQNQKKQGCMQQKQQSEEEQFIQRMKKYMK